MRKEFHLILLLAIMASSSVYSADYNSQELEAQPNNSPYYSKQNQSENNNSDNPGVLSGRIVSIRSGTTTKGTIDRGLSSNSTRVGERGFLTLSQGTNGIPSGSKVEFTVSQVSPAKRGFDNPGELQLKAIRIVYPDGSSANLSGEAYIVQDASTTVLSGNTKGKRVAAAAGKTAVGAGVGALGGLIGSRLGGGTRTGRSVALGTAIGAGVGLAGAAISKGRDVEINSGDNLILKFNQNTQVNVPNY